MIHNVCNSAAMPRTRRGFFGLIREGYRCSLNVGFGPFVGGPEGVESDLIVLIDRLAWSPCQVHIRCVGEEKK